MTISTTSVPPGHLSLTLADGDKQAQVWLNPRFRNRPVVWQKMVERLFQEAMATGIITEQPMTVRIQ